MKLIVKLKEKKTEEILNEIRKISKITHNISLTNYIGVEIEEKRLKDLKKLEFVEEVREPGIARAMLSSAASERCHYLHNSKLCIRSVILDILYKWLHKMNHYIDKTIKTVSDKFPQDYINWIMGSSFKLVEKLGTEIPTKTRHEGDIGYFKYNVIKLWELDGLELLKEKILGLYPLLGLTELPEKK